MNSGEHEKESEAIPVVVEESVNSGVLEKNGDVVPVVVEESVNFGSFSGSYAVIPAEESGFSSTQVGGSEVSESPQTAKIRAIVEQELARLSFPHSYREINVSMESITLDKPPDFQPNPPSSSTRAFRVNISNSIDSSSHVKDKPLVNDAPKTKTDEERLKESLSQLQAKLFRKKVASNPRCLDEKQIHTLNRNKLLLDQETERVSNIMSKVLQGKF